MQDTAARLVAVIDGIGLHVTVGDVPPARAAGWARRLAELELGVSLPSPLPPVVVAAAPVHETRLSIRVRDLDTHGHVDPAVLFTFLEEARTAWLGARVPDAVVTHVAVRYVRPLGREDVVVTCALDSVGRASFRTRETIAGDAVQAADDVRGPGPRPQRRGARCAHVRPRSGAIAAQISVRARSSGISGSSVSVRMP